MIILKYRIIIGFNSIALVATRADLLDRSLIIPLDAIPQDKRIDVAPFEEEFEKAYPCLFGSLLDTLAETMKIAPGLKLCNSPRMADFARWGAAAAQALGRSPSEFLSAYNRNVGRQNEAAIDACPVAQVLIEYTQDKDDCERSPSDWLNELSKFADKLNIDTTEKSWPKNPTWLSRQLNGIQPNLLAMGIQIDFKRSGARRTIRIQKTSGISESPASSFSQGNDGMVTVEAFSKGGSVTDSVTDAVPEPDGSQDKSGD
jgi:hypothetical protein